MVKFGFTLLRLSSPSGQRNKLKILKVVRTITNMCDYSKDVKNFQEFEIVYELQEC